MLTSVTIRNHHEPANLQWITALGASQLRKLVRQDQVPRSLFDERDLAEIESPDYPGERLMVCRNPLFAENRERTRQELLASTEKELEKIVRATTQRPRRPLQGKQAIGLAAGKVIGRFKVGKHFKLHITDTELRYERDEQKIEQERQMDELYVIRTNVDSEQMTAQETVESYKSLCHVERFFRRMKTVDLHVRPIRHRLESRVRAHFLLCMLAYYVEWHMRKALAPMLFEDHDKEAAAAARTSPAPPAERSEAAARKAPSKKTEDGMPVHSFATLLEDLKTIARNRIEPTITDAKSFHVVTEPTPVQQRALDLLDVKLDP
jgi:hypothetical protein